MARIVLASGSPRRQELLQRIGIRDFTIRVPQVEEWYPDGLTPEEIVCYISREKSQAVPSDEEEIVITADTMVFLDDKKLGKPADESEALAMLTALQGRHHTVCTGVTVRQGQRMLTRAQFTHVFFRPASETELRAYIAGGETVVHLTGHGLGGRNQEIALSAAQEIAGLRDTAVFSFGSDGTDGPTDAAGGYCDGYTCAALAAKGISIPDVLQDNDAYHALQACGGLILTGPTGTNVNDLSVLLIRR